jgi:uncharacterized protein involved in copper resistance
MADKFLKRDVAEVMMWARAQRKNPTQSWEMLCQSFCRQAYGVQAWAPSAIEAWGKIPRTQKHAGGKPSVAPRGALLYYAIGKYGHVAIASGIKTDTKCLSNDYVARGEIDYAPRSFERWGARYLGWSTFTPYGSLRLPRD